MIIKLFRISPRETIIALYPFIIEIPPELVNTNSQEEVMRTITDIDNNILPASGEHIFKSGIYISYQYLYRPILYIGDVVPNKITDMVRNHIYFLVDIKKE